jgi:hypothetical protein
MKPKKAYTRKNVLSIFVIVIIACVAGYSLIRHYNIFGVGCTDIIGDGYAMGTDPEPVVIGRVCNGKFTQPSSIE